MITKLSLLSSLIGLSYAHYTFPWINVNGVNSTYWQYTRMTNNDYSLGPVTNVNSSDFRCYDSAPPITPPTPTSLSVAAGTYINIGSEPGGVCCGMYHQSVVNVYMAAVPSGQNAATYEPTGAVWFKVAEVPPITDGGTSITWVAMNQQYVSFQIPSQLPSGNYLVRVENIGLHVASTYGGAQFYISCSLLTVTGGGSGTPGPLVAIPGVYTGYEPGILIDIYYPIPSSYTMPGPALWPGTNTGSAGSGVGSGTGTGTGSTTKSSSSSSSSSSSKSTTTTKTTTTSSASGATQTAYGQCGGTGYTGATTCVSGYTCKQQSVYYSQCLPS